VGERGQKKAWIPLASSLLEPSGLFPSSPPWASSLWEPRAQRLLTTLSLFLSSLSFGGDEKESYRVVFIVKYIKSLGEKRDGL